MVVTTIIVAAGMITYNTQVEKIHLSSIALENVEALARGESGSDPNISYNRRLIDCYNEYHQIIGHRCVDSYPGDECDLRQAKGC